MNGDVQNYPADPCIIMWCGGRGISFLYFYTKTPSREREGVGQKTLKELPTFRILSDERPVLVADLQGVPAMREQKHGEWNLRRGAVWL